MPHLGHMFRLLSCSVSQQITCALASVDLTSAQGRILGYLDHCAQPPCPRDIEEQFQLSHPTVSGLLSRMEKKGFIALRPDPDDRRCKRIYILPKGGELNEAIRSTIDGMEQQIVRGFTPEEQRIFESLLIRAIQNMGIESCSKFSKEENQT